MKSHDIPVAPKFAFNASLRLKFVLFITFPVAAVFIALQNYLTNTELEETGRRIEQDMLQSTNNVALQLELRLSQLEATARGNAFYLDGRKTITTAELETLTHNTVADNDQVFGAAVALAPHSLRPERELFAPYSFRQGDGIKTIDLGNPDPAVGYDYRNRDWWQQATTQNAAQWTLPYFDNNAGNILMTTYAVPFDLGNNVRGVTTVALALEHMFQTLGLPEKTGSMIVNGKGRYLYHKDAELILNASLPASDQFRPEDIGNLLILMADGEPGLVRLHRRDIEDITWVAYAPIKTAQWYYIETLSEKAALEPVAEKLRLSNFIETSGTTALILLIWFLSSLLTNPIRELSEAAEKMAEGDLSARVKPKSGDEMGRLIATFNTMADVVARREEDLAKMVDRRTRELREALDRAEQATRSKGEVLAVASHDLKNPLAAISGLADVLGMMKRGDLEGDPAQEQEMITHIHTTTQHMLEVVGGILQGERLEATGLEISDWPLDLSELTLSVIRLSEPMAEKKEIEFHCNVQSGLDVKGDPTRLREALDNYVSNAVKYSPPGGRVDISLLPDEDDANVIFSVKDQGEGIGPEEMSKLFGKFQKLSARPTAGESSTGLGLSIVKTIIELHGGEVGCDSEPGVGSRFWFKLPQHHES
ncbi:MAG TPA: sensor histidine kinase [Candidatus Acidoferrum sp.]|nr:sensor histidine kinase [Candidatus Acidoferrum sp.]